LRPLRVALVGLGWWGRTILALLQGNAKLQVVHTVDANPAVAVSRISFSTDYEEALRDPAVEAAVLANLEASPTCPRSKRSSARPRAVRSRRS